MDFLLVSATSLTAVEMLGFLMDIFHVSLSGSFVPLNLPMPHVLNKNPALVISACPEQVTLEHRGLLWHVQSCTGGDTWGGLGVTTSVPELHWAALCDIRWENDRLGQQKHETTLSLSRFPKAKAHTPCMQDSPAGLQRAPQKPILLTLPRASTPNPFTEMIIAVRNQFSLAKEEASS